MERREYVSCMKLNIMFSGKDAVVLPCRSGFYSRREEIKFPRSHWVNFFYKNVFGASAHESHFF